MRNKHYNLISYPPQYFGHVSQDTVREFESVILQDDVVRTPISPLNLLVGKGISRTSLGLSILQYWRLIYPQNTESVNICIFMGPEFQKAVIPFLQKKNNNAYFFDAWPDKHEIIYKFIQAMALKNVFFSSKQVANLFKGTNTSTRYHWIPEAINIEDYSYVPYVGKDIDVLSFGRKYDVLHERLSVDLESLGIKYVYEKKKGEVIFPDRTTFIDGLARSKLSICIPSNVTSPERSGAISTMTVRYLQSMAAKALIVGIMPDEMRELFNYDPIITIDMQNPSGQISDILKNYLHYTPLIEKNYSVVKEDHTWKRRWETMRPIIG